MLPTLLRQALKTRAFHVISCTQVRLGAIPPSDSKNQIKPAGLPPGPTKNQSIVLGFLFIVFNAG